MNVYSLGNTETGESCHECFKGFELPVFLLVAQCEWPECSHVILNPGCYSCWFIILNRNIYWPVKRKGQFKPVWK